MANVVEATYAVILEKWQPGHLWELYFNMKEGDIVPQEAYCFDLALKHQLIGPDGRAFDRAALLTALKEFVGEIELPGISPVDS